MQEEGDIQMTYDVLVIGGGLSGLAAASLLAKRGLQVALVDKSYNPGGSCGIFKRGDAVFDQGSSMLFGFGERGFNAHRFVFDCLEEPIDVIRNRVLYCVNFRGHRIRFWEDIDRFITELSALFPSQRKNLVRFYGDMRVIYRHVMEENPTYATADEASKAGSLRSLLRHPVSFSRFLGYLDKSARQLLSSYFDDPEILKFFDKLTSTYCYATLEEAPAILAAVMFVDNHVGGSYYPAGSTLYLPGKLEKVIEEHGGTMVSEKEVVRILFDGARPVGVALDDGQRIDAADIVYSGTVWNLYGKLVPPSLVDPKRIEWARNQIPTFPSVILYAIVDREAIPSDTEVIEMLIGNPDAVDESEVTVYIHSIDDHTICNPDVHVLMAIGPSLEHWEGLSDRQYQAMKKQEEKRLLGVLEKRFPGIGVHVRYSEVSTPRTIERYTLKNGGAVAGPKQMLGQHMFKRLHVRTEWDNLFCCGESTVMGTGTPTVTVSGVSAANAILEKRHLEPFVHDPHRKSYVRIVEAPVTEDRLYSGYTSEERAAMKAASRCLFCEHPTCNVGLRFDIRQIMRRVNVGNFVGAWRLAADYAGETALQKACEQKCIRRETDGEPVRIAAVMKFLVKRGERREHESNL
jgi:prolycopene isomerase